ncbi:SURF1 family cytochrome oxidase biogenesis protein [Cryobacterium zongtaii]|uniref:SURF1 family cytochrome oxidase biogenesis protein n=1 Tax=Cryobacterium zongtaii TaxID=1259217 RepID=UPI001FAEE402|nr:SURF1 family cytochrome oxidase biogenesis protein [Cryobacterium zongtaii]
MMVRPRWIAALLLALAIAGAFAALGQWQLARAISSGEVIERTTETVQPLTDTVSPDGPPAKVAEGQMIETNGSFVAGDEQIISGRHNGGESGFWVVSHFVTEEGVSIAVARGWTADADQAAAVRERLATQMSILSLQPLTGRFLSSEAPALPDEDADPHTMTTVSTAALINLWANWSDQSVYQGYIVDTVAPDGLTVIDSPEPEVEVPLNWLNIFYALEWVVFAGFAVFLWYRLVRDAWERETEEAEVAAAAAAEGAAGTPDEAAGAAGGTDRSHANAP